MAAEAPYTGARSRAPRNQSGDVPPKNIMDQLLTALRDMQVAAEAIDAMTLGVEVMIENQRRIMADQNAGSFLLDNELWSGMATLLTMVRHHSLSIGKTGEAAEVAGMRADKPAAA